MVNMSSFNFFLLTFIVILSNENLFCTGENSSHLKICKELKRSKREIIPNYNHQQFVSNQPFQEILRSNLPIRRTVVYQQLPQNVDAQSFTTNGYSISKPAVNFVTPQSQQQIKYIQSRPTQSILYSQPAQSIKYTQPIQKVEYVQPSTSVPVQSMKLQKQLDKKQNNLKMKQPTAYTSQTYYTSPITSIPEASFITPREFQHQGYIVPETSYSQGYSIPEATYSQGYSIPEASYPQGYPIPETSFLQGYPIPKTSFPQDYPIPKTSFPQGYTVPETTYSQDHQLQKQFYPQDYSSQTSFYTQKYRISEPYIVDGPNYIETSPEYLRENKYSLMYPYNNKDVRIYPNRNIYKEIFKLPETVDTPAGRIKVELVDIESPYSSKSEIKVPRVTSIEGTVESQENIVEDNSVKSTTQSSFSLFK